MLCTPCTGPPIRIKDSLFLLPTCCVKQRFSEQEVKSALPPLLPAQHVPATSGLSGALPSSACQPLPSSLLPTPAANNPLNKGLKSITGIFNGGKK